MRNAFLAALLYFALVFMAGFALGTVRTFWIAPHLGLLAATALELPIILALAWLACGFVFSRIAVSPKAAARITMGATALLLLLTAEALLSSVLAGLTLRQHFALYETAPVLLGLLGQIAFAAFPLIRR